MAQILVVDDDTVLIEMLIKRLVRTGHKAKSATTIEEAKKISSLENFDLVFLDVQLPDGNGLEALPALKSTPSAPEIIIFTGEGDPDGAEMAIKSGAWDYIEKPNAMKDMLLSLSRALEYRTAKKKAAKHTVALKRESIIGSSEQLKKCLEKVAFLSSSDSNVLITGETGTGKELFARMIHVNSAREVGSFVVVDCTALPESLVESTLFGHEKGAFTGADKGKIGLMQLADRGTLFLDEVGELSISIQKKFLRALQERRFRPIGSRYEVQSNFRLLAATNKNLDKMVDNGTFRNDLLFRLRTATIELPPLRDRNEDIRELSLHYINKLCKRYNIALKGFSPDFLNSLLSYSWPGNVRELVNVMETAVDSALHEPILYSRHLPDNIRVEVARRSVGKRKKPSLPASADVIPHHRPTSSKLPEFKLYRAQIVSQAEQDYLVDLLKEAKGSIKEACQISGLGRTRLYSLMKKHNISRNG